MSDHQISYVFANFAMCFVLIVAMILFILNSVQHRHTIWKYHDTISSFCAKENSWENKFLLFFCTVISLNLTFLHFEEFNSRPHVTRMELWLFIIEVSTVLSFMIVGILDVAGKNPNTENKKYDLGNKWCPCNVQVSSWIHSVFALGFMLIITTANMLYASEAYKLRPNSPWAMASFAWGLFSIVIGTIFIALQITLYWYGHLVLEEEDHHEDQEVKTTPEADTENAVKSSHENDEIPSIADQLSDPDVEHDIDAESQRQSQVQSKELERESRAVTPPPLGQENVSRIDRLQRIARRILARKLQYVRVGSFALEIIWTFSIVE